MTTLAATTKTSINSVKPSNNLYIREKRGGKTTDWVRSEDGDVTSLNQNQELGWLAKVKGAEQADLWVIKESFAKTPKSVAPLLEEMKKKSWSTDLLAFEGEREPVEFSPKSQSSQEKS